MLGLRWMRWIDQISAIVQRPHHGYRLASWRGTVPAELAKTFADSRRAMDDMPTGDTDYGVVAWDVDRVLAAAQAVADRGDLLTTVVAVDDSDGTIVGFSELVVPGDGRGDGQHYGTGVLPEHRGHDLGRWMKAEMVRLARINHPELSGMVTDTADNNVHMRRINDALGYLPTHQALQYQLDLWQPRGHHLRLTVRPHFPYAVSSPRPPSGRPRRGRAIHGGAAYQADLRPGRTSAPPSRCSPRSAAGCRCRWRPTVSRCSGPWSGSTSIRRR
jgi:GNAT superfamily N-acetyltransferase